MSTPPSADSPQPATLGSRVTVGAAWMIGVHWGVRGLGIISTIILARLLMPEDFGLVALATAYIAIAEGVTAMPIGQALISYQKAGRSMYDTAFTFALLRGLLIAAAMAASAGLIAEAMSEPRLTAVVYALALKPLIEGLINPRFIDYQKQLSFSTPALLQLAIKLAQVLVTIGAVVILRSYWALVIGTLLSAALHMAMTYALKPNLPRLSLADWKALFGFSGWLTARSIVMSVQKQFDKFLIGAFLNTSVVGLFHVAGNLIVLPTRELVAPLTRALYPGLATFGDEPDKLRANVAEASAITAALALPLGVGLALIAEEFVLLLLGEKWLGAVPLIQILTPLLAFHQITALLNSVVMVQRRTHLMFIRTCVNLTIKASLTVPGIIYFGLNGVIGGLAITLVLFFFYRLAEFSYVLKTPLFAPVIAAWRSLASLVVMISAVLAAATWLPLPIETASSAAWSMLVKISLAASVYTAVHAGLWVVTGKPAGLEQRVLGILTKRFPEQLARA
ncbi:MAG: lipopolysaccharide biosynthesis protein [Gammaproteobacteria bacterium]|nr:lipopolysaccharide biosynthesis protein [Gammaproteobacteria bacterium]